jgi:F-type H+-transporting ATPase subunit epsilon
MALNVALVSPERTLFSGEATFVTARAAEGDITFLTGHAPYIGALDIGLVRIRLTDGTEETAAVHGGFVEVFDNRVIILSDAAEMASQIDVERARRAQERAEGQLRQEHNAEAEAALRRAHMRIEAGAHARV